MTAVTPNQNLGSYPFHSVRAASLTLDNEKGLGKVHPQVTQRTRYLYLYSKSNNDHKNNPGAMTTTATTTNTTTTTATVTGSTTQIPCCLCGVPIVPNAVNQCGACLSQQFDLKDILQPKGERIDIYQCRECRRYARTDTVYENCEPESPQLLSICLKHIPGFIQTKSSQVKLQIIDAIWVWTEPHCMRLKVRVTVRAELESVPMQQRIMVEFQVKWKHCPDCDREYTSRTWQAIVQLRQKREQGAPRKGLAALEMALKRNVDVRKHVLQIDSCRHGLDFYFLHLAQAQTFASFLSRLAPMRLKTSQKLVSTNNHDNTAYIKHTLTADMVPLCRDDLIVVGKGARGKLAGRLGLVLRVTSNISIVDASPKRTPTMETMDVGADQYYKAGGDKSFPILQTSERMIRWVVLDVELLDPNDHATIYEGPKSRTDKYAMAEALVARETDMGQNDTTYSCVTHLGHLIQPGDIVLGYDLVSTAASLSLSTSSLGVVELEDVVHSNVVLPDVVLVKKVSGTNTTADDTIDADDADDSEPVLEGKKRVSKRKLRRRKKQDKKQRELEEAAARMGFLEVLDHEDDHEELTDEELAADVEAVEKELAAFQIEQGKNDGQLQENLETMESPASSGDHGNSDSPARTTQD